MLQLALPGALRQSVPASVGNFIEEQVSMDGELEILHEDRAQGSRFIYKLKAFGLDYSLYFKKNPPTHLSSGVRVTVQGVRVSTALALDSGASVQTYRRDQQRQPHYRCRWSCELQIPSQPQRSDWHLAGASQYHNRRGQRQRGQVIRREIGNSSRQRRYR